MFVIGLKVIMKLHCVQFFVVVSDGNEMVSILPFRSTLMFVTLIFLNLA